MLREEPGQLIGDLASSLEISIDVARALVKPMIGTVLETSGVRRGTRYYLIGEAPAEDDDDARESESDGKD